MSQDFKPRLSPTAALKALPLSPAEGFLASRIDGHTTVRELAALTGLTVAQVGSLLDRLGSHGALAALPTPLQSPPAEPEQASTNDEAEGDAPPGEPAATDEAQATHLKLYRLRFHPLAADERAALAATVSGEELKALCFDPVPAVIRQVLTNPRFGLEQARLIAAHHRNPAGLEHLLARGELVRDAQVQRLLWRNPQLNEGQLRRLTQARRLLELWKLSISRDATSQTRASTLKLVRARFPTASAEERVELIFSTEGRALAGLAGLPIDGKTTSLLCARSYTSVTLVQHLSRWSVAPPVLIAHLLRQPLVARQPQLKAMLLKHPNAPAAAKGQ